MAAGAAGRNVSRRILKELETWNSVESKDEKGVERLGPVQDDELFKWEAVVNGRGIGSGYDEGRWLLTIQIPPSYPLQPPNIEFVTPIVHPNINLQTGEICLDLLKDAWTPAYSVLESVRAVRMLLGYPEINSPLNLDVASLIRDGDHLGARNLVELWVEEERYEGL